MLFSVFLWRRLPLSKAFLCSLLWLKGISAADSLLVCFFWRLTIFCYYRADNFPMMSSIWPNLFVISAYLFIVLYAGPRWYSFPSLGLLSITFPNHIHSAPPLSLREAQSKVTSIERSSFRIEPLIFLFFNIKGTCSLNSKKPVSGAKAKICGLSNSMGRPQQITDSGKPTSW